MADQKVEMGYPTNHQQPNVTFNSDDELRRRNRIKTYIYIGIFIVFLTIVISVLGLTVMKVKIRLGNIYVQTLNVVPAIPSFDMSFAAQARVRNKNWGPYKYETGVATFLYQGVPVGQVLIPQGNVGMRSTKKIDGIVSVNSGFLLGNTMLGTELGSGILMLTSTAKLSGEVKLMWIMKKNKPAEMDCSMVFNLATKTVQNLKCE